MIQFVIWRSNWRRPACFLCLTSMTTYTQGRLCVLGDGQDGQEASAGAEPRVDAPQDYSKRGRPVLSEKSSPSSSDTQDEDSDSTDPDDLMDLSVKTEPSLLASSASKPRVCPVCNENLASGLALERHLQSLHPLSRMYGCYLCRSSFNTS